MYWHIFQPSKVCVGAQMHNKYFLRAMEEEEEEEDCRSIAILIFDDTSIVGVTILFGTATPVSIAILQRYLRNDLLE